MARYEVTGPDGSRFEINAPDGATEAQVMEFAQQQFATMKTEPEMSTGEVVADVAKSAGIGAAQGAMGLATLPGNLEALGRAGINYGASAMGYEPPVDADTYLPNYNDAKKAAESYTGKFYKPKSVAGEYARTIGEFLPAGIGGGGLAARAARVAVPAVASESAGQLTKGTSAEPWARAGGAIVGGLAPNLPARMVTPAPQSALRAKQVQELQKQGVTSLTAGQRTGSKRIRSLEDASQLIPLGGGKAERMQNEVSKQFTKAALKKAGIDASEASGEVLEAGFRAMGKEYQQLGQAINLRPSPAFVSRLQRIVSDYKKQTPNDKQIGLVTGIIDDLKGRPSLAGNDFVQFQSQLKQAARKMGDNEQSRDALNKIVQVMEAQAIRSAPKQAQGQIRSQLRDLNKRYRNLSIVEDAVTRGSGEAAAQGIVSPAALTGALKKRSPREYSRERSELGALAKSGNAIIRPLSSSGTAERQISQKMLGAGLSSGPLVGGGAGYMVAPEAALAGMLLGGAAPAVASRTLMSRPMQAYLGNQSIPSQIPRNAYAAALAPYLLNKEDK